MLCKLKKNYDRTILERSYYRWIYTVNQSQFSLSIIKLMNTQLFVIGLKIKLKLVLTKNLHVFVKWPLKTPKQITWCYDLWAQRPLKSGATGSLFFSPPCFHRVQLCPLGCAQTWLVITHGFLGVLACIITTEDKQPAGGRAQFFFAAVVELVYHSSASWTQCGSPPARCHRAGSLIQIWMSSSTLCTALPPARLSFSLNALLINIRLYNSISCAT